MSNKPKGWKSLPGKVVTAWDDYCRRFTAEAIRCAHKLGHDSKHQGGMRLAKQYHTIHDHIEAWQ